MNILTIQHLCFYLEDIGIIDQASISPFLSLYSFAANKLKENTGSNNQKRNSLILFENALCAYLKKIFSFEKNYKIFSNKIINKFKQHFMIKQYNGLTLLFIMLSKKLNLFKIQSFYKILKKQEEINITNLITNNNVYSNSNTYTNINSQRNTNNNFKERQNKILNSYRKNKFLKNKKEENKYDIVNKSLDFIKLNNNQINYNSPSSISKNSHIKNIQLEFHKKQFLSKIKREHIVKFKRSNSNSAKKLKKINSNKDFKFMLLNNFSPINNQKVIYNEQINENWDFNNIETNNQNDDLNKKNYNTCYNNFEIKKPKQNKENYFPKSLKEDYSTNSEIIYLNSFTNAFSRVKNKEKVGHLIKNSDKNNNINTISNKGKIIMQKNLSLEDINKIKKKLEELNYFNLNKEK